MIQDAKNRPISELFDIDSKVVYFIPRYQREYSWSKTHWESLFDDIFENNPGYFLGSIICINQSTDALAIQRLELVDGQQRLTTISLLLAAVYQTLKSIESEMNDEGRNELFNLKNKLVIKRTDDQIRVIPQIQNNNHDDYRAILAEIEAIPEADKPRNAGNRKIFKAYRYFQKRIQQMIEDEEKPLVLIMDCLDKVNRACLVKIDVASHADAYTLFESLNNRGLPLTAIDLIKNKLLAQLETIEPGKVDHYFTVWNRLLSYLGDDYAIQERFFRQYYNAFKEELNKPFRKDDDKKKDPLGTLATRSNIIHIYEKLINHDAKNCLKDIGNAAQLYSLILSLNEDEALNGLEKPLEDLDRIQGAPSYLLMLFLLVHQEKLELSLGDLTEIVQLLVCFFVRRNLTDLPPTRDLTRLFMGIIESLNNKKGADLVEFVREKVVAVSATDESFKENLEGSIYAENTGVTRFVLCSLAEQGMTRETQVDLWRIEGKQYIWTIEHVFPQGENIPSDWVTMIAAGDEKLAKEYQETYVHKLGNLTISGYNPTLGNKSFEAKRDRKNRQGLIVGYKNGLLLNKDLANADKWSIEQIEERTEKLVDATMKLFSMERND